jgi:uncharacterized membrane protein YhaH (DUF805 family)
VRVSHSSAEPTRSSTGTSNLERAAGISLFLIVTLCWVVGLVSAEQDWVHYPDLFVLMVAGLSAVSVVATGYLGQDRDALWLGWLPGTATMAIGFAQTPAPGGDETGGGMIFIGGLVLLGWAAYFFPLIALGVRLRRRRSSAS